MAITFKYRNHLNLSYAPGVSYPGKDGLPGKKGISGNSMYFVDFDLDNSYSIDLALQKIENNNILTNDSNLTVNNRPYKVNDLLVSNTGNVYKIVEAVNDEAKAKNYKFDIKFLGKLHHSVENDAIKVVIYDITGLVLKDSANQVVKYYPARQKCCVPTNRSEKSLRTKTYTEENDMVSEEVDTHMNPTDKDFYMYGTWIKPVLWVGKDLTTEETVSSKRLKYSLQIELNNKKEIIGTRIPGSKDSLNFNFNKVLEFANPGIIASDSSVSTANIIYTDEFLLGLRDVDNVSHSKFKAIYLSDMQMDKFHPCTNNIQCTLNKEDEKQLLWYKIGRDSVPDPTLVDDKNKQERYIDFPSLKIGGEALVDPEDEDSQTYCEKTIHDFTDNVSYYAMDGSIGSETLKTEMFPKYAYGKSLVYDKDSSVNYIDSESMYKILNEAYNPKTLDDKNYGYGTLFIDDDRNIKTDRSRIGDSAYFSSIIPNEIFDSSYNGVPANEVSNEIFDFISDDKNNYKLVVKKVNDKTVTISEISVEFNTTTFKNAVYRQFEPGGYYYKLITNYPQGLEN